MSAILDAELDVRDLRGVPIAQVSTVLGVPLPTLRSWELRYAMPTMRHKHGRHRRYFPAEVHALRLMRDEIARGQQAGLAAATVRQVLGIGGAPAVFIHRLLAESQRMDTHAMRVTLTEAALALGLADCVDEVLLPAMRQVGIWWEVGHCDITQEQVATEAVRGWLHKKITFAPASGSSPPILLACGPNDWHTIGLESLAMLLRYQGWPCLLLGARASTAATAAAASNACALVLVSQMATGRRAAVQSLQATHQMGVPVFYAGHSFMAAKSRRSVPGHYLGSRLQDAANQIIRALTAAEPSRPN